MSDKVAVVIGRHTEEPFIEGGGKVIYQTAQSLSDLGINTYLFSLNYSEEDSHLVRLKSFKRNSVNEIGFKTNVLSEDAVLNKSQAILASNLIELTVSPILALRFIKKISEQADILYLFIGNASKLISKTIELLSRFKFYKTIRIMMILRREELYRWTVKMLKPDGFFTTSKELSILAQNLPGRRAEIKCFFSYPPIEEAELMVGDRSRDECFVLYMGRVSHIRFPLDNFKEVLVKLKMSKKDVKFLVGFPPERPSVEWFSDAKTMVRKHGLENRVIFIPRILSKSEKARLLRNSSIFIYPSKVTAAIEPPLSVLEGLAFGQYLIATGANSTFELVKQTAGHLCRDFSTLQTFDEYDETAKKLRSRTRVWAENNISPKTFARRLTKVMSCF